MKKLLFTLPLFFLLCGCNIFLPAGVAPDGAITDNSVRENLSDAELENNAVTTITAFLLTHQDISRVCAADLNSAKVLNEAASITGTAVVAKPVRYTLMFDNRVYKLYDNKRLIWQYPEKDKPQNRDK